MGALATFTAVVPLEWGDVNIIHTTDTHGWLLGHQKTSFPEPNYSGDLGDFASFVSHMKQIALEKDVDLLLIDSGDLHDGKQGMPNVRLLWTGTGLSDGFPPGGVDGHETNKFLAMLPYDVMAIVRNNHEMSPFANTLDMHVNFAPKLNGRYLTSNVNITVPDAHGNAVSVPVGSRFAKFKTKKGREVTALGVLFSFTGFAQNTTVQPVADLVKESWFKEVIQEEPDFFLLVGHMPVQRDDWPLVFNAAVRAVHPTTPILILGGHTHIRDCVQLDGRSMSLESGRYMETVQNLIGREAQNITFSRRYLDPNRVTYEFHAQQRNATFDTLQGKSITNGLLQLAQNFDLNFLFGTAPQDFTLSRDPFPSNGSLLTLFSTEAMPFSLTINNTRANIPKIMITNSGSQRFDILKGPFTKNDQFTASPFSDAFVFIPSVPSAIANKVLPALNDAGADERKRSLFEKRERLAYERGYVDFVYRRWLEEMDRRHGLERRAVNNLTLGYVTTDACPGIGDDSIHAPLPFFPSPDFIGSNPPNVTDDTPIDLVFVDFIEDQLIEILNSVQSDKVFSSVDVQSYTDVLGNQVLGLFAQHAWN
ncbi:Calcineurin-like phosphoesterase domain-containing protein [Abortiporus biennis]